MLRGEYSRLLPHAASQRLHQMTFSLTVNQVAVTRNRDPSAEFAGAASAPQLALLPRPVLLRSRTSLRAPGLPWLEEHGKNWDGMLYFVDDLSMGELAL
jgi:hypothetical protein